MYSFNVKNKQLINDIFEKLHNIEFFFNERIYVVFLFNILCLKKRYQ